jgi:hypothetical protein
MTLCTTLWIAQGKPLNKPVNKRTFRGPVENQLLYTQAAKGLRRVSTMPINGFIYF